jgi:trk system potassium uptake protein TrkA
MRVVVVGAGEVGFDVARILSMDENDVVVVDIDPEQIESVNERLDVMTVLGHGTSAVALEQAGIRSADLLVAVTAIDEVNIIACMLASRIGVETTIARIRSTELAGDHSILSADDLGIDLIIHPEESTAKEIVGLLHRSSATDSLSFADGNMQLVGMRLDADCTGYGQELTALSGQLPQHPFRIAAIVRGVRTILPRGSDRLALNDQVFIVARPKDMPAVVRHLGKREGRLENIMILGGTEIGMRVAEELSRERTKRVKLIEPNRELAERRAEALENVLVIHGKETDIDLLAVEGLAEMDAFVAVTKDEESNLVACLLAKHLGVKKTVALLSKVAYIPISQSIGLDAAVSSKLAVSREILAFLRGKHVLSVATVHGLDAEIIEMEADPGSPVTKAALGELNLPRWTLIAAVDHGKESEVATGSTVINAGDRAIVFVLPSAKGKLERLFLNPRSSRR